MKTVICLVGPTASGKTSLSIALAKKIGGEIISADSMQVYQQLDIATAKVTKQEREGIPHHLIDIVPMTTSFSVSEYKLRCYLAIDDILSRNKVPIIVGGTGLYVSAVMLNMNFEQEQVDMVYREKLYRLAKEHSKEYVHDLLMQQDKESAMQIHPNNLKRVVRALEMCHQNKAKSLHIQQEKERIATVKSPYSFELFCLTMDKGLLEERINLRVDKMLGCGLEKEAKMVYNMAETTAKQAVGYKEFFAYFEGKTSYQEVVEEIKLRSRQYAKRQMTWFRKMQGVQYIDALLTEEQKTKQIMEKVYGKKEDKKDENCSEKITEGKKEIK